MTYHIEKSQQIQDKTDTIFYEGDHRWSTVFEERKIYQYKKDATSDLYGFGGTVVSE
jgi:hypothetical protein